MGSEASGSWRAQLDAMPAQASASDANRLGLLFQLRTLTRDGSQWTAPAATTATSIRTRETQRLAVRPALQSKSGNWTTSAVTWGSLTHKVAQLNLDPANVSWFSQLQALHRSNGKGYRATEPDWLYLDEFDSPLLWPLLRSATTHGIALLTSRNAQRVEMLPAARVVIEVSPDGSAGALRLRANVEIDSARLQPTGTISDHGVYVCDFDPDLRVMLAEVPDGSVSYLGGGNTVRVPAAEAQEFWDDYYPTLTTQLSLRGRGVDLPEVRVETVLIVEFRGGDVVLTRWETWVGPQHTTLDDPPFEVAARLTGVDAAVFIAEQVPVIEAAGIRVVELGERPDYRPTDEVPTLRLTAIPTEGHDWFELGFVIMLGEYTVPFADVFKALSRGRSKILLVDKTYLNLNQPIFDALRALIEEGADLAEWETGARISRYRANVLEPFEDTADDQPQAHAWRRAARALTGAPPEQDAPDNLQATLRPYQLDGFRWLAHLHESGLGGILADDMGLGKTLQAIALMQAVAPSAEKPFLVVAPTSVVGGWVDELRRFAPDLQVSVVGSTKDPIPATGDVVVTSYALFRLENDRFAAHTWESLILDEAQYVKNPESQVHEAAVALPARTKFALTGTPMENSLLDLWAILRITAPGLFASRLRFSDRYMKAHSEERVAELRGRIRPLMLRRTKTNVALELPARSEQVITVDLSPAHRRLYDRHLQRERQKLFGLIEDLDRNRFIVFRSLTLLRMLALDPSLIGDALPDEASVAKLDELVDRLEDLVAEGHRALVFSQFTSFLALARGRLDACGIRYEYLDGSTTRRPEVIARFRDGDAPVFLVSLRAGGVGLTLTEADSVFLLDPWWNPAAEAQAIDRTHRIGQTKPVMVYRLVARDTIEEKVVALSEAKRALFDEVINGGDAFSGVLTADDVRALLA